MNVDRIKEIICDHFPPESYYCEATERIYINEGITEYGRIEWGGDEDYEVVIPVHSVVELWELDDKLKIERTLTNEDGDLIEAETLSYGDMITIPNKALDELRDILGKDACINN